jgi:AcrR family transcriptional regulator
MVAPTLKPPQQNRSRKAANALLQAGLRGIETRGIAGLSMADVAAEAGASVGSLYFRFGDKSQFVGAALAVALDEFRDRGFKLCDLAARKGWTERQVLEGWVAMLVGVVRDKRVIVREMISHMAAQPSSWEPIHEQRRKLEERLFSLLFSGRGHDSLREMRLRVGLQAVAGNLIHMLVVNPGPLRIDDPSVKDTLCDLLFSYIDAPIRKDDKKPRRNRAPAKAKRQ